MMMMIMRRDQRLEAKEKKIIILAKKAPINHQSHPNVMKRPINSDHQINSPQDNTPKEEFEEKEEEEDKLHAKSFRKSFFFVKSKSHTKGSGKSNEEKIR